MITPKEETLQLALQDYGLRALPKAYNRDSGTVWITGIALVTKVLGQQEYVKCTNNGLGVPVITRDYGAVASIISVDAIYPVDCVDKRFTPDLRSDKAIITFLSKNGHQPSVIESLLSKEGKTPEQIKTDRATTRQYINQAAIKIAKKTLAEEARIAEMHKYAETTRRKTQNQNKYGNKNKESKKG